jgi:hypothetical protein
LLFLPAVLLPSSAAADLTMCHLPHGIPHNVVSDQGTNFIMKKCGSIFMPTRLTGLILYSIFWKHIFFFLIMVSEDSIIVSTGKAKFLLVKRYPKNALYALNQ